MKFLILIGLLILLDGCASSPMMDCPPSKVSAILCQPLKNYQWDFLAEANEEADLLPQDSALAKAYRDYQAIRNGMRAGCTAT